MLKTEFGDLLNHPTVDAIMHQCNCFHTMGGGIAAHLKSKWPSIAVADKKYSKRGDHKKLGTVLPVYVTQTGQRVKVVFNCYSQYYFGTAERNTDYEAFYRCCEDICRQIVKFNYGKIEVQKIKVLGVPYKIGCGLGGGNWEIISSILQNTLGYSPEFDTLICQLPEA